MSFKEFIEKVNRKEERAGIQRAIFHVTLYYKIIRKYPYQVIATQFPYGHRKECRSQENKPFERRDYSRKNAGHEHDTDAKYDYSYIDNKIKAVIDDKIAQISIRVVDHGAYQRSIFFALYNIINYFDTVTAVIIRKLYTVISVAKHHA